MGKQTQGTKCLYRKSNYSLNTRSRTCSGTSQILLKSKILQLKKKHPKTYYYVENGKVKRDLSIETDICILRGYYKRKFGRFKRSVHTTEVGTNDERKPDHNSCGDSIPEGHTEQTRLNIDVTSLVVENLKDLLNGWIKKYLLNNNETKQKIDTVLDSILHKLELQRNSSSCTYTLDIKVDDKNQFESNKTKGAKLYTHRKESCQTVPVTGKRIKLISTLSIPRNAKRHISINSQCLKHATRKIRYKNVFLTISRSSTFLLNSSSFNLINISTKSFTKRCATYDSTDIETSKKKKEVVLLPKSSFSDSVPDTNFREKVKLDVKSKIYPNELEIEPVQSLVKSIYADDPANITSTDKNIYKCKHDHCTMTDTDYTLEKIQSPTQCHKLNWRKARHTTDTGNLKVKNKLRKSTKSKTLSQVHKMRKTKSKKKQSHSLKCLDKKNIDPKYLYKKSKSREDDNKLLKDLQSILKHFTHNTDSKNVKFDVRINLFPGLENNMHDDTNNDNNKRKSLHNGNLTAVYNVISSQIQPEVKTSKKINENHSVLTNSLLKSKPELISILDGAISQSKYVISKEESYDSTDNNIKIDSTSTSVDPANITTGQEIAKDISELRVIIRDLAITTEKFVKEHLEHLKSKPQQTKEGSKNNLKTSTLSKAVQHTVNSQVTSGLKLKKEPKKKGAGELNNRLCKKSISYNIIESESILKVTDMTSETADINKDIFINKALNCSLPKSKSQFEITVGHSQRKLLAYYCDELVKSRQFMQNRNTHCTCSTNTCNYTRCTHAANDFSPLLNEITCHEDNAISCEDRQPYMPHNAADYEMSGPGYSSSSISIDVEDRKKFAVRSRSGMSFWEGLLYCILLWIPVVIIFWLIYVYVIKDIIQPTNPVIGRTKLTSQRSSNNSLFHITLSDLGF